MLMRRDSGVCPHCGQRMLVRHGVKLSPVLADLFDLIERSGHDGIETEVLTGTLYPGKPISEARACVKSNVSHLNALLAATDVEVRAGRHEPYRVTRRTQR